jgi:hypothetical protein
MKTITRTKLPRICVYLNQLRRGILFFLLATCALSSADTFAAPDEIAVYADEINAPGEFAVEQHVNYSITGTQTPAYSGQMPSNHVLQVTPEFTYGLSKNLEAGLYVPFAFASDGNSYFNDFRVRLKYIASRQGEEKLFYGLNVETGSAPLRTSEASTLMELRPIIGYRTEQWLLSFNPNLNFALSNGANYQPTLKPGLKWTHSVSNELHAGVEYYGEYGALNNLLPESQLSHSVFAVVDVATHALDANFGIGHGFVNATDAWVIKAIIALPFN